MLWKNPCPWLWKGPKSTLIWGEGMLWKWSSQMQYVELRYSDPKNASDNSEKSEWDIFGLCSWYTDLYIFLFGKKRNCGHSQGYMIFKFICHCRVPDCSKNFFMLGITKKFFCFAKNIALVVFLGVFSILIMVYDKQFTYYNKLLLPQGNWVDDTTHPSMIFSMHELLESNRTL